MLRFNEIAFGPIHSRRLGSSLGINILPAHGKLCNFDCIYCECGWNKDGAGDKTLPGPEDVEKALTTKLEECRSEGAEINSITFSGNGEPTLNPFFPAIIDEVLVLRDKYYPESKISVLSNATRICKKEVFEALRKIDNPILKIDASTDVGIRLINRPTGKYILADTIENLKKFDGNFILQTMFLKSADSDSAQGYKEFPYNSSHSSANDSGNKSVNNSADNGLLQWINIVRELHPREIMVYTIDRETPDKNLKKYTVEEMTKLVKPLIDDGFSVQIKG